MKLRVPPPHTHTHSRFLTFLLHQNCPLPFPTSRPSREQDNPSLAIICYEEALEHDPKDASAMIGISAVHFSLQNFSGAQAKLEQLLHHHPDHAEANHMMADVYRVRHELSLHGGHQGSRQEEIKAMMGEVVHYYKKAIEANPKDDLPYASLGSYYLSLGDFEAAISTLEEGLEANEESHPVLLGLADTYKHKEEYETCLHFAQKALKLDSMSAYPYGIIGECALFSNQPQRSVNALQKACQLDPGNHHFLHLLVTAVRSNVAVEPAEALRVLKRLDLEQYHDAEVTELFHELMVELSDRANKEL